VNATQYIHLLNNPSKINGLHSAFLEKTISEFPYFQSARALQLKNLFNQDSFKYNQELRKTAAHTTDRSVLFEFISSERFVSLQKLFYDEKQTILKNIIVSDYTEIVFEQKNNVEQKVKNSQEKTASKLEQSIIDSISSTDQEVEIASDNLEIGKPLHFSQDERHSFQEWLQLAHFKPIERNVEVTNSENKSVFNDDIKKRKQDIIDKFISTNPKISPIKNYNSPGTIDVTTEDNSHIMTETLAKVYLEQKKYQKAIQAYEILILKYPEKFSFFANRMLEIKNLQQNNN
jgi:tetratricopeptide (TPR) repeat protein